jgi:valyl-tRNA synthetase
MAKTNLLTGKNPFENVAVSGWVLDPSGKKMSKSKGNVVVPQDVIEKYSADGIRFAASSTKLGNDIPYQEKEVQSGVKVANKIYNACKFAEMLLENFTKKDRDFKVKDLNSIDMWILYRYYDVMQKATSSFEKFDYSGAKFGYEQFFMNDIADNYLEIVKERLWKPDVFGQEESKKAQKALYTVLYGSVRGLAPFMPYITEQVYQNFFSKFEEEKSIHITNWPNWNKKENLDEITNFIELGNKFIAVVSQVRKFKAEKQISMKEEISKIEISCDKEVKDFIEDSISDLKAVTSTKEIEFKHSKEFEVKIIQ